MSDDVIYQPLVLILKVIFRQNGVHGNLMGGFLSQFEVLHVLLNLIHARHCSRIRRDHFHACCLIDLVSKSQLSKRHICLGFELLAGLFVLRKGVFGVCGRKIPLLCNEFLNNVYEFGRNGPNPPINRDIVGG